MCSSFDDECEGFADHSSQNCIRHGICSQNCIQTRDESDKKNARAQIFVIFRCSRCPCWGRFCFDFVTADSPNTWGWSCSCYFSLPTFAESHKAWTDSVKVHYRCICWVLWFAKSLIDGWNMNQNHLYFVVGHGFLIPFLAIIPRCAHPIIMTKVRAFHSSSWREEREFDRYQFCVFYTTKKLSQKRFHPQSYIDPQSGGLSQLSILLIQCCRSLQSSISKPADESRAVGSLLDIFAKKFYIIGGGGGISVLPWYSHSNGVVTV